MLLKSSVRDVQVHRGFDARDEWDERMDSMDTRIVEVPSIRKSRAVQGGRAGQFRVEEQGSVQNTWVKGKRHTIRAQMMSTDVEER